MNPVHNLSDPAKHALDAGAVGATIATLFSLLPKVAALLSVVWLLLRCFESYQNIKLNRRKLGK